MKFLIVCALMPMAMCLPAFLNEDKLKADVEFLAQKFASSDLTRKACETECQKYMDDDKELNVAFGCPLACLGIQSELVKLVTPDSDSKRAVGGHHGIHLGHFNFSSILSFLGLNLTTLKQDAQTMIDVLGADATEQMMEDYCKTHLFKNSPVLQSSCPLIAKTFQKLIQTLHLVPDPGTPGSAGSGTGGIVG